MKNLGLLFVACFAFVLTACQRAPTVNTNTTKPGNGTASGPIEPKTSEAKPPTFSTNSAPDTGEAVKFPFPDFPNVNVTAKAG